QRARIQHMQKARLTAPVLDVRPIVFTYRREIKTIPRSDECNFLLAQRIRFRTRSSHWRNSAIIVLLRLAHRLSESELLEIWRHEARQVRILASANHRQRNVGYPKGPAFPRVACLSAAVHHMPRRPWSPRIPPRNPARPL